MTACTARKHPLSTEINKLFQSRRTTELLSSRILITVICCAGAAPPLGHLSASIAINFLRLDP